MDKIGTERSPKRFDGYVDELKSVLAGKGLASGRPQDLISVAAALRQPGAVREDLAAVIRSILARQSIGFTRAEVAAMLVVAVGGTNLYASAQEVNAVGQLDSFVDWVMGPIANVSLGGDAVAQAVEPFWGIVEVPSSSEAAVVTGTTDPARLEEEPGLSSAVDSKNSVKDTEVIVEPAEYPAFRAIAQMPKRSYAISMIAACGLLIALLAGGFAWKYHETPGTSEATTVVPVADRSTRSGTATVSGEKQVDQYAGVGRTNSDVAAGSVTSGSASVGPGGAGMGSPAGGIAPDHAVGASSMPAKMAPAEKSGSAPDPLASAKDVNTEAPLPRSGSTGGSTPTPETKGSAAPPAGHAQAQPARSGSVTVPAAGASASAATSRFVVSSGVMSGHLINAPEPAYPKMARMWGIQGEVVLQAVVSRKGQVVAVRAMDGHKLLRGAAENTVRKWRYRPYLKNGKPTDVDTVVIVDFHLPS